VLAVAGVVACAEVEGLRAVCGPVLFVVEFGGVPYDLVCVSLALWLGVWVGGAYLEHELWDLDWVRGGAVACGQEVRGSLFGVRYVVLV